MFKEEGRDGMVHEGWRFYMGFEIPIAEVGDMLLFTPVQEKFKRQSRRIERMGAKRQVGR